jgi:two-component system, OmpR family, phosphate regulon sensor histidine kinase PhoR
MPIDYGRLLEGLTVTTDMVNDGRAGLAAIDSLAATARDATGATGSTFTEYGSDGGRVVVANGTMAWALGQPVSGEFINRDLASPPWIGTVDELPASLAEPLRSRGVGAIAGHPVRAAGQVFGSVHVYFEGSRNGLALAEVGPVLRLVAGAVAHVYGDAHPVPTGAADRDDRPLFLAVAGHELRTPVTVVKGYASMLSQRWDTLDEPNRRAAAGVLSQRADELARLVDRLLGASVGDGAAGWLVRTVPFDPIEALRRAAEDLPEELRRSVRLELPSTLPPASGDPAILTSIVGELVTNAVRYTDRESGTQVVEVQAGADTQTVFVRVCDRGIGIDPADVERAFERFWRAHREGGGVGLGLFLVRRLVERQGGWVSLRPRDGGGTVAEVRLPRADAPKQPWAPGT